MVCVNCIRYGCEDWLCSMDVFLQFFFTKYFIIVLMRVKDTFVAKVLRSMRPGILFYVTHAATLRGRKVNECGRGTQILQNSRCQIVSILRTHEY
jgi:hypothetical protein